jgi:AcrR family transcriptional regulator
MQARRGDLSGNGLLNAAPRQRATLVERERVVDIQRARLLAAMTQIAVERGAGKVTVAHVVERAGVSRRTFYELFSDCEECLVAALDLALECAHNRLLEAHDTGAPWRVRVRSGLIALLRFFEEEPVMARLLVVESMAAGRVALQHVQEALAPLIATVDEGRFECKGGAGAPPLAAEAVVGGAVSLVRTRLSEGSTAASEPLVGLTNQLMSMIVLPYLGGGGARRELERPLPEPGLSSSEPPRLRSDPFKDAGRRLTYRTMRVLSAVADRPGSSNRQVCAIAEVHDQGQMSKLLGRLQRLGLIDNTHREGHLRGEANAWVLTAVGEQVVRTIRTQSKNTMGGTSTR